MQGLIDLHGGFIGASSDGAGKGTKFHIDIPICTTSVPVEKHIVSSVSASTLKAASASAASTSASALASLPLSSSSSLSRETSSESSKPCFTQFRQALHKKSNSEPESLGSLALSVGSVRSTSSFHREATDSPRFSFVNSTSSIAESSGSSSNIFEPPRDETDCKAKSAQLKPAAKAEDQDNLNLNLLIVDDSSLLRKMVSRFLVINKICVAPTQAPDGAAAVKDVKDSMFNGSPFDVIMVRTLLSLPALTVYFFVHCSA